MNVSQESRYSQNVSSFDGVLILDKEDGKVYNDLRQLFFLAARYGHIEMASLLLRYGANPHDTDIQGVTPIHVAACHGHHIFIRWLISERPTLDINIKSENLSTPLHSGAICKSNGDMKPLIDMGASIHDTDQYGMTPLHYAVMNAFSDAFLGTRDAQCQKLVDIAELADPSYINKVDNSGRTALHLAARNVDLCCVKHLLQIGARADLTDSKQRKPLDVAINFAPPKHRGLFFPFSEEVVGWYYGIQSEEFSIHDKLVQILLSRETFLSQQCDERLVNLLNRVFETLQPTIAEQILSKSRADLVNCKNKQGKKPLLIYLQNGGLWLDVILMYHNVTIYIECGKSFYISEFHLAAFGKPTVFFKNILEERFCNASNHCFLGDGPLAKAIKAHPLGFRVIDECRDAEGYTALQRAAQGGNSLVVRKFLSWGADPTLLTPQGQTAFDLAVSSGISPFSWFERRLYKNKIFVSFVLRMSELIKNLRDKEHSRRVSIQDIFDSSAKKRKEGAPRSMINMVDGIPPKA